MGFLGLGGGGEAEAAVDARVSSEPVDAGLTADAQAQAAALEALQTEVMPDHTSTAAAMTEAWFSTLSSGDTSADAGVETGAEAGGPESPPSG